MLCSEGEKKYLIEKHDPGLWVGLGKVEVGGIRPNK